MLYLEQLNKILEEISDEDISKIISHGAMQYTDEISQTVSFVFWICYMAEQDLSTSLKEGWGLSKSAYPEFDHNKLDDQIEKDYKIKAKKIDPENKDYNSREITFGDLIFIKERFFGKTNFVKLLWKLKKLRDDLSHGRIEKLKYDEENLSLKQTKKKLLMDYFKLAQEQEGELSMSKIWEELSEEYKKDIKEKFDQMVGN
ncbi:MAG: hypothetical protein ABIC82_03180 [bacterium]